MRLIFFSTLLLLILHFSNAQFPWMNRNPLPPFAPQPHPPNQYMPSLPYGHPPPFPPVRPPGVVADIIPGPTNVEVDRQIVEHKVTAQKDPIQCICTEPSNCQSNSPNLYRCTNGRVNYSGAGSEVCCPPDDVIC